MFSRIVYILLIISALSVGFTMNATPLNITFIVLSLIICIVGLYLSYKRSHKHNNTKHSE